jgi:HSP20 family protein
MMALTRWDPFGEMLSLRQALDRLFEESVVRPGMVSGMGAGGFELDVFEKDDALEVKASLPGVKPEDVTITVEQNMLTIQAEMRKEWEEGEGRYHRRERRYGRFSRSILLPCEVESDRADAEFRDGVLTVRLPKVAQARTRRIEIRGGAGRPAIEGERVAAGIAAGQAAGARAAEEGERR